MADANAALAVRRCFRGPNIYCADPTLEIVWDDSFLSQPDLSAGIPLMSAALSHWIDGTDLDQTTHQDIRRSLAGWLTNWTFLLMNSAGGRLRSQGTTLDGDRVVSWITYHNEGLAYQIMLFAARLIESCSKSNISEQSIRSQIKQIRSDCFARHPDYQARHLMEAADSINVPYSPIEGFAKSWQYGWGCNSVVSREANLAENSTLFCQVAANKFATKKFLRSLGVPVGDDYLVRSRDQLQSAQRAVGFPCVTKPIDGKQSSNVTVDIRSNEELLNGFDVAREFSGGPVVVEQMRHGDVYRLLVVRGEYLFTIRRIPASVTGDGISTIRKLLEKKEAARKADPIASRLAGPVPLDAELHRTLNKAGYSLESILAEGLTVRVRALPRSSRGGKMTDLTEATHDHVKQMAVSISRAMGLQSAGIDYITSDISKPPTSTCGFIEVNSNPSLNIPMVAGIDIKDCARALFGGKAGRIPSRLCIVSSESALSSLQTTEMSPGEGWVRGSNCGIGQVEMRVPNASVHECIRTVLRNPLAESISVVMVIDDLVKFGLPLDRFDEVTFIGKGDALSDAWRSVLKGSSETLIEKTSADSLV